MEYFKVVSVSGDKLTSYNISGCPEKDDQLVKDGIIIEYEIGQWTYPKINGSNLFCVSDLNDAKEFRTRNDKIFRCEVKNPSEYGYWTGLTTDLERLTEAMSGNRGKMSPNYFVSSNIFCDAIKLLEEIQ